MENKPLDTSLGTSLKIALGVIISFLAAIGIAILWGVILLLMYLVNLLPGFAGYHLFMFRWYIFVVAGILWVLMSLSIILEKDFGRPE